MLTNSFYIHRNRASFSLRLLARTACRPSKGEHSNGKSRPWTLLEKQVQMYGCSYGTWSESGKGTAQRVSRERTQQCASAQNREEK